MQLPSFSEQQNLLEWCALQDSTFQDLLQHYAGSKKAILVDENTQTHCLEFLLTSFEELAHAEVIVLPAGEQTKSLEICAQVWETLTDAGFGRHDLLINLGGGVVTDLGGFVAAVYKRGIAFINVPTSLLAMVDASIGGKTGVDLAGFKNQIGLFAFPIKTYLDQRFLQTLPKKEWLNGYAELLKHALIADANLWKQLVQITDVQAELTTEHLQRGVEIKATIVSQDPSEKGLRKVLNFGHTIGHALESYYLDTETPLDHGHAVAIGLLLESQLSTKLLGLPDAAFQEIKSALERSYSVKIPKDSLVIWELMQQDKKNKDGEVRICLLSQIGACNYDQVLHLEDFQEIYATYTN
jgi:3-dehydroquinate synthase